MHAAKRLPVGNECGSVKNEHKVQLRKTVTARHYDML